MSEMASTEVKSTPEKSANLTTGNNPRLLEVGTATKLSAELPPEVTEIESTLFNGIASVETKSRKKESRPPAVKSRSEKPL